MSEDELAPSVAYLSPEVAAEEVGTTLCFNHLLQIILVFVFRKKTLLPLDHHIDTPALSS